ncbi:DUF346 domain-containing protein [Clostridium beijerinckii]|nr:DUF346 domain-containing protein [Clostridium beijerinckii]OOM24514.1 hypothetical protein CLOBE_38180 [Clostridium beijerinckii]
MYNDDFFYCPYCMQKNTCPFFDEQMKNFSDNDEISRSDRYEDSYEFQDSNLLTKEIHSDSYRASDQEVNRILRLMRNQMPQLFSLLQGVGDNYFRTAIAFTLDNAQTYSGNINQGVNRIFNDFRRRNNSIFLSLRSLGVPNNVVNLTFRSIIEFTLRNINPSPTPGPNPTPSPSSGWSKWEDLGGVLKYSPGVSSWSANRLDVFVTGSDNALYHKWWDGSRWSDFENLGGSLTSGPAAVSWGNNRIDVFGKGSNDAMYHKWWDGSRWSDFENLGGVLTSGPAAVSWGNNRIDVFVRGQGNRLYHKWWDGSRWNDFEDLGGNLASAPAVSSRASNRLEVFARNQSNQLITKTWNGSRWSDWQTIGGSFTLDPAAVSWSSNRTDVFAKSSKDSLLHIWKD